MGVAIFLVFLWSLLDLGCCVEVPHKIYTFDITNISLFHTPWPIASDSPLCAISSTDEGIAFAEPVECSSFSLHIDARPTTASTCFRTTFRTFGYVTISLSCVRPLSTDQSVYQFSIELNRVDKPPVCMEHAEVRVLYGGDRSDGSSFFFLKASDPDTEDAQYFTFEILSDSLADLKGYLTYCGDNCTGSAPWRNLTEILADNSSLETFSGMFGYHPPPNASVGFSEKISFVARDLADEECDPPGVIIFRVLSSAPPIIATMPSPLVLTAGLSQTFKISAASLVANSLLFSLVSAPDVSCVVVCPVAASVIQALASAPGDSFSGSAVDCDVSRGIGNNTDITLTSATDSFLFATFIALMPLRPCTTAFSIIATDGITSSALTLVPISVGAPRPGHCLGTSVTVGAVDLSLRANDVFDSVLATQWSLLGWVDRDGAVVSPDQYPGKITLVSSGQDLGPLQTRLAPGDVIRLRPPFPRTVDAVFLIGTVLIGSEVSGVTRCKLRIQNSDTIDEISNSGNKVIVFLGVFALFVFIGAVKYWKSMGAEVGLSGPYRSVDVRDGDDAEMRRCVGADSTPKIRWKDQSADDAVIVSGLSARGSSTLARRDVGQQKQCADEDEFALANQPSTAVEN